MATPASNQPPSIVEPEKRLVRLLESLLPQGKVSDQTPREPNENSGPLSAELIFEKQDRKAKLTVTLSRSAVPVPAQFSQCPDTAYHPFSRCKQHVLPGGGRLIQDQSPRSQDQPAGAMVLTALRTDPNGGQILVTEANAPGAVATGIESLPLTLAQLSAIATSSAWSSIVSTIPSPPTGAPLAVRIPRMSGQQISRILTDTLPTRLHVSQASGSEGFGHVVVNDGRGKSLVAVNVQQWRPDAPAMKQLFEKSETLPDGTRVATRQGPASGDGHSAIAWTVDTFRRNGLRVVISAVNAPAYHLPASREQPAIPIKELKEIALVAAWQQASR